MNDDSSAQIHERIRAKPAFAVGVSFVSFFGTGWRNNLESDNLSKIRPSLTIEF
jgi:hypothetical protein